MGAGGHFPCVMGARCGARERCLLDWTTPLTGIAIAVGLSTTGYHDNNLVCGLETCSQTSNGYRGPQVEKLSAILRLYLEPFCVNVRV